MAFVNRRPDHFDLGSTTCHSQTNAAVVAGDTETTTSTHAFETSHMCSIDNCVNLTWQSFEVSDKHRPSNFVYMLLILKS